MRKKGAPTGAQPPRFDPDDDVLDGVLFRFWIRAATYPGGWPFELATALSPCQTPADYRAALIELAQRKGVNLPIPEPRHDRT